MSRSPRLNEILSVLAAASSGDYTARISVPENASLDDLAAQLAIAVNLLLDDFAFRAARSQAAYRSNQEELERVANERSGQLRESESKFARAFQASPAAISIASLPDGRWLEINDALVKLTGFTPEEAIGKTSAELGLVDAAAREKILGAINTEGRVRNVEIQIRNKAGEVLDVLVSVEQVEINGQPCALTIQHDITELKRAEREVNRLNEDLQQRQAALEATNSELEAFSYSVAHDLRAPLRGIDGFSLALLEDYGNKLDPPARAHLERVRSAAQQMGRLIDALLSLSRVSRSELHREPVYLTALAESVLARLQKRQPERRAELVIADGLKVNGDPHLLGILLENLLGNAWKFTEKCPLARIEVGATQDDHGSVYFVRDNGAGFDMAYAGKLFGMFQRLHAHDEFEGTGIGLATVQRIVHRHGGRVWAEAEVDRGATVYFTLSEPIQ